MRAAGAIHHPRRAVAPVAVRPPAGRVVTDLEPLRRAAKRPTLIHDTRSQPQPATFGQGCVSVGHEDLPVMGVDLDSSTLTGGLHHFKIISVVSLSLRSVTIGLLRSARGSHEHLGRRGVGPTVVDDELSEPQAGARGEGNGGGGHEGLRSVKR